MSEIGGIISGIRTFLPTNTDTSGNSSLTANTASNTANIAGSMLKGSTDTGQSSTSGTTTNQTQTSAQTGTQAQVQAGSTVASASKAALDAISSNIGVAQKNATDSSKTTDLVSNILTQAAMTFAPTKTLATGAGLYNSPTLSMLSDFAQGSATAQAAGAVLNYQTAQQGLAEGAASDLAKTTATTATAGSANGTSTTNQTASLISSVLQSMFSNTAQNTSQNLLTANQGSSTGTQAQNTTSQQSGSSGMSIICTELMVQGKLDKRLWIKSSRKFMKYPQLCKESYWHWAMPAVLMIKNRPESAVAKLLTAAILARSSDKVWGIAVINTITFFAGLHYLATRERAEKLVFTFED